MTLLYCAKMTPTRNKFVAHLLEHCLGVKTAARVARNEDGDCDNVADDGFDVDGDGSTTCGGDCNDGNAAIRPGAVEGCDAVDSDCDGAFDDVVPQLCFEGPNVTDDTFEVDLRENPDQAKGPVNTTRDGVMVSAQMLFKSLTDPYSPANEGSFRPIRLLTREGSVFHVREPGPIGFYYEIELRVYDLMWRCLAPHIPERLASGHFASVCGTFIGGTHPDTGRQYTIIEPQIGGWGARNGADGNL
jgi:N-methylhydantoinase B/oxoprolinase/acetone carboxylase alpha subunit